MKFMFSTSIFALVSAAFLSTGAFAKTLQAWGEDDQPWGENDLPLGIFKGDAIGKNLGMPLQQTDPIYEMLRTLAADQMTIPSPKVLSAIRALDASGTEEDFRRLKEVLDLARRNASGWAYLAIWSVDTNRPDEARAALATALDLNHRDPLSLVATAAVQKQDGDVTGAIATLRRTISEFPNNFSAASRLSNIYAGRGELAAAVAPLDAWLSQNGVNNGSAAVLLRVSQMLMDLKSYDRAQVLLQDYVDLPGIPENERRVGILLGAEAALEAGDLPRARDFLAMREDWHQQVAKAAVLKAAAAWGEGASDQAERQLAALKDDRAVGALATRYLAGVKFDKGEVNAGAALCEAAIVRAEGPGKVQMLENCIARLDAADAGPRTEDLLRSMAHELGPVAHVILADRQIQQQRYDAAIETGSAGLATYPQDPELHFIRGMAAFMNGNLKTAEKDFATATELNPDHTRAWVSLAKMQHDAGGHGGPGRHVGVIATYMRALEASPDNVIFEIELGKVAQEEGRPQDAETWFRKALHSAPGDPLAQSLLAILLVETGKLPQAQVLADKAIATLPEHHQVLFAKGRVELASGNLADAAKVLIAANARRPEHGHSLAYAASALFHAGRKEQAAEMAEKALYLALRDEEVKLVLDVLAGHPGNGALVTALDRIDPEGIHETHGAMQLMDTPMGMRVTLELADARPGPNAVHLHENPNCAPGKKDGAAVAGLSAGAHFGSESVSGDAHAHHEMPMAASGDATDAAPMQRHGPMIMKMDHGGHSMEMVMREYDLAIGDLPPLMADAEGTASYTVFVPYLHTSLLRGRSVVVHDGTSTVRAYCGVFQAERARN